MKRVLVIGDCIADVYHECTFKKMCPDNVAVPATVRKASEVRAGGAANVALNLAALSPSTAVDLIGVMQADLAAVVKTNSSGRVSVAHCLEHEQSIVKERFLCDGKLMLRVDSHDPFDIEYVQSTIELHLTRYLQLYDPDLILMSDYAHGTIGPAALALLLTKRDRLLVDTKMTDLRLFGSGGVPTKLAKLNMTEWSSVTLTDASPERSFESFIVTKGKDGSDVKVYSDLGGGKSLTHTVEIGAFDVETADVCGCGDTFLAGLAASLLMADDPFVAARFASAASATVVQRERTSIADLKMTLALLGRNDDATET